MNCKFCDNPIMGRCYHCGVAVCSDHYWSPKTAIAHEEVQRYNGESARYRAFINDWVDFEKPGADEEIWFCYPCMARIIVGMTAEYREFMEAYERGEATW